jgi:hypothetical protein
MNENVWVTKNGSELRDTPRRNYNFEPFVLKIGSGKTARKITKAGRAENDLDEKGKTAGKEPEVRSSNERPKTLHRVTF